MSTTADTHTHDSFFRCPITSDCSRAKLKSGRHTIDVVVQDASIDGFTILVAADASKRLKVGTPWVLEFDGSRLETQAQWFYHDRNGQTQVGLRRMRDLTPIKQIGSWYTGLLPSRSHSMSDSTVLYAGVTIMLFLVMAMPGLGEHLGTATRIEDAANWLYEGIIGLM